MTNTGPLPRVLSFIAEQAEFGASVSPQRCADETGMLDADVRHAFAQLVARGVIIEVCPNLHQNPGLSYYELDPEYVGG